MSKQLAMMHLNSSVYELMETKEGKDTHPLYKQINNPVLVLGVVAERRIDESWNEIEEEMVDHFETTPDQMGMFGLYPMEKLGTDTKINCTLVYGQMVEFIKPDPKAPVAVQDGTPEAIAAARKDALTPKPFVKPFFMVIPETDDYMFSLSFDHVPVTAITSYKENADVEQENSATPQMDLGLAKDKIFIAPEDQIKLNKVRDLMFEYIRKFENEHPGEQLPKDLAWDAKRLIDDGTFKNEQDFNEFMRKFSFFLSMMDLTPESDG